MTRWAPLSDAEIATFEAAMRSQLGVPWRHQGRKGCGYGHQTGLDCIGIAVFAGLAVDRKVRDLKGYGTEPNGELEALVSAHLGAPRVPPEILPRRLVAMKFGGPVRHIAYISDAMTLIHCIGTPAQSRSGMRNGGKVIEHAIDPLHRRCIARSWAL